MIKVLLLMFSFLQSTIKNIIYDLEDINIITSFNEKVSVNDEIVDQYKDYNIIFDGEKYKIIGEKINITTKKFPSIIEANNKLYVAYIDENIKIFIYSLDGELIEEIVENIDEVVLKVKLVNYNNSVLLLGNHYGNEEENDTFYEKHNLFIYDINKREIKLYGGTGDEFYLSSYVYGDNLYICFKKEKISYGDFGNGGSGEYSIGVCILNTNLQITYFNIFNIEDIQQIKINDSFIYLKSNENIYLVNHNLKLIDRLNIIEFDDAFVSSDYIIAFIQNKIIMYDSYTFEKICEKEYELTEKLMIFENNICLKEQLYYDFDILNLKQFQVYEEYYKQFDNKDTMYTLYGKAKLLKCEPTTYFDESTFGRYNFSLVYENANGIPFELELKQYISLKTNVTDNMSYCSGYRIISNGIMYLDGDLIINNLPIYDIGEHHLLIEGVEESVEYTIIINEGSEEYNDEIYSDYNYLINENDTFKIGYDLSKKINPISVVSKPEASGFEVADNKLYIMIDNLSVGMNYVYISYIEYLVDDTTVKYYINKVYKVVMQKSSPQIMVSGFDDESLTLLINSVDENLVRGFEFIVTNNGDLNIIKIPLLTTKENIIINGLKNNNMQIEVYLYYYNGCNYKYEKMFDIVLTDCLETIELGNVYKNSNTNDKKIKITFENSKKNINEIKRDNMIIYSFYEVNYIKYIGYGIGLGGASFAIIYLIRKNKKRKPYKTKTIEK